MGGVRFAGSSWRRAFADELIRLRPDLNPDAVDELSDAAFLSHADVEPNLSARLFSRGSEGYALRSSAGAGPELRSGA
jgi:hypothetical protein